jgi:hypothetical protein
MTDIDTADHGTAPAAGVDTAPNGLSRAPSPSRKPTQAA